MSSESRTNDRLRRELERQRQDQDNEAQLQGYRDAASRKRAASGDRDAPFVKAPPFPSDAEIFFNRNDVPDAGVYFDSVAIQVALFSQLVLWVDYTPDPAGGILSLIPESLNRETGEFSPIAVIDPFLTVGVPVAGFASREVYQTELRTPTLTARWLDRFQLDVSGDEVVRFRVGEAGQNGVSAAILAWSGAT